MTLLPLLFLFSINKMGRKRYYCDYCQRFFNDDINARSKHLNSVSHQNAKAEHYNLFKSPELILQENITKKPCIRFQNEGYCQFGSSCTYSHYSRYQLQALREEIIRSKMEANYPNIPPAEFLLQKYHEIQKRRSIGSTSIWSHELPDNLLPIADSLPISLQPFNIKIYENINLDSWG